MVPWLLRNVKERDVHNRAKRLGISLPADISYMDIPLQKSADDRNVVYERWPFLLPYELAPRLISSNLITNPLQSLIPVNPFDKLEPLSRLSVLEQWLVVLSMLDSWKAWCLIWP